MTDANTLRRLADRAELEDVLLRYYYAVDSKKDLDGLVDCFTEDAVFDVADLGLKAYTGHAAIRAFFEGVFATTEWHCHHLSNFHVVALNEDTAQARGYVFAKACGTDGSKIEVNCCYDIDYVRTANGWKIVRFDEDSLIPLGSEVAELHKV
ncbi:MAG: nuclear transport factor 2 family protein [Novosphingobium sp.]